MDALSKQTSKQTKVYVPEDFYCPITGSLMVDPVSEPDGHTYEKAAIYEWLSKKEESPLTRKHLIQSDLSDNVAMRKSIESLRGKLAENQLKIDSKVFEGEQQTFIDTLDKTVIQSYYHDNSLLVKISVPDVTVRPSVDVALCIDVSGSMGTEATLKGPAGETIHNGISVLALTIAAAKTIMSVLNENDRISIITYTDGAKVIVSSMETTDSNKMAISTQLDQLRPLNTTNLWAGIHESLKTLKSTSPACRQKSVFLLTDGVPNIEPPRGHEYMIERYMRDNDFNCPITCYGFGYQLNSPLLDSISKITGGDGYSFIPDSSLLGNVFIHGISNFLTTATSNVKLTVKLKRGVRFTDGTQTKEVMINSLKYGQDKNLLFSVIGDDDDNDFAEIFCEMDETILCSDNVEVPEMNYYNEVLYRHKGIQIMNDCLSFQKFNETEQVKRAINPFIESMKGDLSLKASQFIQDMIIDFEGQIKEALNMTGQGQKEDWYNRWGKHYLLSLSAAYSNELCTNFRDKGISHFGGGLFHKLRDEVSDTFDSLPPPKQTIKPTTYRGGTVRTSVPISDMSSYNSASGPCCAHDSLITTDKFSKKLVQDLKRGDMVMTVDGHNFIYSEIECVVKTICPNKEALLVQLGNLKITPYHPIIHEGLWEFPIHIGEPDIMKCPYLYTFVIRNRGSVVINDYIFSTLGHGLSGDVIEHEYFGTDKIVQDLKLVPGYDKGLVCLEYDMIKRDPSSHKICKIEQYMVYANL